MEIERELLRPVAEELESLFEQPFKVLENDLARDVAVEAAGRSALLRISETVAQIY